jgi:hypothetical protein
MKHKLLLFLFGIIFLGGCGGSHRSDDDLIKLFLQQESSFEEIANILKTENKDVTLPDRAPDVRLPGTDSDGISENVRVRLKESLDKIDARTLYFTRNDNGRVTIEMSKVDEDMFIDNSHKGFTWLPEPPEPSKIIDDLNVIPPDQSRKFKHIKKNWWLYTYRID